MITTSSKRGRLALMVAHCAGMIDLVALPVWVGTLITQYRLDPQQAGLLASLFLGGAVLASVGLAHRFVPATARVEAAVGFGAAAMLFGCACLTTRFAFLAGLHAACGLATGVALSATHGTIARSANPHRLFALVGMALGVFAIVFLGGAPQLVARQGGVALFQIFSAVMALAALASALAFPRAETNLANPVEAGKKAIPKPVWFGIAGIACMALVQSMTFSFLERVGHERGFGLQAVTGVLVALGFVNLFPALLAAILERRLSAKRVMLVGPWVQAILVVVIMSSAQFAPYAFAASVFAAVMLFTHTFAFGLLARLDRSGRAMAATPAMLMVGAAIGPLLGGTLVKTWGYASFGPVAFAIALLAALCFSQLPNAHAAPTQEVFA
ncbi:MAG: MFS transporter [Curvibacter sp.]|nr:MFS transporter [Curvibacter sp.]